MTDGGETDPPSEVQLFVCDRWLRPEDGHIELRSDKCKLLLSFAQRDKNLSEDSLPRFSSSESEGFDTHCCYD